MNSLDIFHPLTAQWFAQAIGTPTAVQQEACTMLIVRL